MGGAGSSPVPGGLCILPGAPLLTRGGPCDVPCCPGLGGRPQCPWGTPPHPLPPALQVNMVIGILVFNKLVSKDGITDKKLKERAG